MFSSWLQWCKRIRNLDPGRRRGSGTVIGRRGMRSCLNGMVWVYVVLRPWRRRIRGWRGRGRGLRRLGGIIRRWRGRIRRFVVWYVGAQWGQWTQKGKTRVWTQSQPGLPVSQTTWICYQAGWRIQEHFRKSIQWVQQLVRVC